MYNFLIRRRGVQSQAGAMWLASCFASSAGYLNVVTLTAFGFFPSNMTGNFSQISSEVSKFHFQDVKLFLQVIGAFFLGTLITGLAVSFADRQKIRTSCIFTLMVEGGLLIFLAKYQSSLIALFSPHVLVISLGFILGMHNTISTWLSKGQVRATHMTGTLTDAGISLGQWLASSKNKENTLKIFNINIVALVSFTLGGVIGFFGWEEAGFNCILIIGIIWVFLGIAGLAHVLIYANSPSLP